MKFLLPWSLPILECWQATSRSHAIFSKTSHYQNCFSRAPFCVRNVLQNCLLLSRGGTCFASTRNKKWPSKEIHEQRLCHTKSWIYFFFSEVSPQVYLLSCFDTELPKNLDFFQGARFLFFGFSKKMAPLKHFLANCYLYLDYWFSLPDWQYVRVFKNRTGFWKRNGKHL